MRTQLKIFRKLNNTLYYKSGFKNQIKCFSTVVDLKASLSEPIIFNKSLKSRSNLDDKTYITKLENGLTVSSQNQFGVHAIIGVFIKSGPRYEINHISGISHFIEKLGFKCSENFNSTSKIQNFIDECGAVSDCQLARDMLIYGLFGDISSVDKMVKLLSEVITRPLINDEEIEDARQIIEHEHQMMRMVPPPDNLMQDLIHQAAFNRNTLGLPRYTSLENVQKIKRKNIVNFLAQTFRPENMILVGVGCEHQLVVEAAQRHFPNNSDYFINDRDYDPKLSPPIDKSIPQITGGCVTIEQDLAQYHFPMPEFAHVSIGLEGVSYQDPHFVPACVLQTLMGEGSSFSAGGPGKGMYSRLSTEILGNYGFVNSASAMNHSYADGGLFTINGSCDPGDLKKLIEVLCKQIRNMGVIRDKEELDRAKSLVRTSLLMNLEHRSVVFEDIGRQLIYKNNERYPLDFWEEAIERVQEQDIRDLVNRMINSRPSLAAFGRLKKLPTLESINSMINTSDNYIPKIFNKFK